MSGRTLRAKARILALDAAPFARRVSRFHAIMDDPGLGWSRWSAEADAELGRFRARVPSLLGAQTGPLRREAVPFVHGRLAGEAEPREWAQRGHRPPTVIEWRGE